MQQSYHPPVPIRRRAFMAAGPPTVALACKRGEGKAVVPSFEGQDPARGHRIRDGALRAKAPGRERRVGVLIVGAGAAGLSAAWRLRRSGFNDFAMLELESALGGTARAGRSEVSPYPMGAHYLPVPHPECRELETLLEELGLLISRDSEGRAHYLPSALCPAPAERHLYRGVWHEGLYPGVGETAAEADDWARWQDHLRELDEQRDAQGRRMFRLPLRRSSDRLRHLDRITIAEHLDALGIESWRTRWLIDYACRDDYGTPATATSAFAALHHFLARGREETRDAYLLTAPEGNGRLVEAMAERVLEPGQLELDTLVFDVDPDTPELLAWRDDGSDEVTRWRADAIIWAAPRFILSRAMRKDPHAAALEARSYAPWLVANLALRRAPAGPGSPLAWDNVAIDQDDLGYVVATHGRSELPPDAPCQISFYQAFAQADPEDLRMARAELLAGDAAHWGRWVLDRLERMHAGIGRELESLRLHRWGHAMVRPTPGSLFGEGATRLAARVGRVRPCGTDNAGIALFEEAFYAGLDAADEALAELGGMDD